MRLRDRRDDRKAEARALSRPRRVAAAEALEGALEQAVGEAPALVGHVQLDHPAADPRREDDLAAAVGERVRHEVVERLRSTVWVGHQHDAGLRVDRDPAPRGGCRCSGPVGGSRQQPACVERLGPDREAAGVRASEHEEVAGEP